MGYERTITSENVKDSLFNGDKNILHADSKATEEFANLTNIKCPGNSILVPGILIIQNIEFLDEIKEFYPIGMRDINFISPLFVENKKEAKSVINYHLDNKFPDPPFVRYRIAADENGRELLSGDIVLTDKNTYNFLTKEEIDKKISIKQLSLDNPKKNRKAIEDIVEINESMIEPYCRSIGISKDEYSNKYGNKISGMVVASKIPAKLFDLVSNEKGLFAYKKQSLKLIKSYEKGLLSMSGTSENLRNTAYHASITIKNDNVPIVESYTAAFKVA